MVCTVRKNERQNKRVAPGHIANQPVPKRRKEGSGLEHQAVTEDHLLTTQLESTKALRLESLVTVTATNNTNFTYVDTLIKSLILSFRNDNLQKFKEILANLENASDFSIESLRSDAHSNTIFHLVALHNSIKIAHFLFDKIKTTDLINLGNASNHTPLQIAAQLGCVCMLELLILKGADVQVKDMYNRNLLYFACKSNTIDTVYCLIKNYPSLLYEQDKLGQWPSFYGCYNKNPQILVEFENCLIKASSTNDKAEEEIDIIKPVSSMTCSNGDNHLHVACRLNNYPIVHYLCESHSGFVFTVNYKNQLPLHIACQHASTAVVRLILLTQEKLEVFGDYKELLCQNNLSTMGNTTYKDSNGNTPLKLAKERKDDSIIKLVEDVFNIYTALTSEGNANHPTIIENIR